MKKFGLYFLLSIIVIVVTFFLVSLIVSKIHNVTMIVEWQNWLKAMKIIQNNVQPVKETALIAFNYSSNI